MAFQHSTNCRKRASQLFRTFILRNLTRKSHPRILLLVTCSLDNICAVCPHNAVILFQLMNSVYIYVKQQSILIATQAFELKLQRNVGTGLTIPSN